MNILTKDDIKQLVNKEKGVCASIYLPTYRKGNNIEQNQIAFKNLLRKVQKDLENTNIRKHQVEKLLEEPEGLLQSPAFWKNQNDGLAAFISEKGFSYHRFPIRFESLAVTGNRFHLKPLLPMLSGDGRFFLLTLNLNRVRLFQGTHFSVSEIELEQVPDSLKEVLKYDDPERHIQYHSGVSSAGSRVKYKPTFHGQVVTKEPEKNNITRFFQKVDKGIQSFLGKENSPLVLAGVDHLAAIYRQVNNYAHLLDGGLRGNPEDKSVDELHRQSWSLVKPIFQAKQKEAAELFAALTAKDGDRTSTDIKKVVAAAHFGRIDTLFVPVEKHVWGTFDSESGTVELEKENTILNDDLIDLAAVQTIFHGGTVYAVDSGKMPEGSEHAAAILRF